MTLREETATTRNILLPCASQGLEGLYHLREPISSILFLPRQHHQH